LAAFIHVASEMAFILNSARLLPAAERISAPIGAQTPAAVRPAYAAGNYVCYAARRWSPWRAPTA
jgi:hypothetical protein